jgi:hypothetical protein
MQEGFNCWKPQRSCSVEKAEDVQADKSQQQGKCMFYILWWAKIYLLLGCQQISPSSSPVKISKSHSLHTMTIPTYEPFRPGKEEHESDSEQEDEMEDDEDEDNSGKDSKYDDTPANSALLCLHHQWKKQELH